MTLNSSNARGRRRVGSWGILNCDECDVRGLLFRFVLRFGGDYLFLLSPTGVQVGSILWRGGRVLFLLFHYFPVFFWYFCLVFEGVTLFL